MGPVARQVPNGVHGAVGVRGLRVRDSTGSADPVFWWRETR